MKIAIDCEFATSEYRTGIHWYSYNLIHNLAKIDRENSYILYHIQSRNFKKKYEEMQKCLPEQKNFQISLHRLNSSLGKNFIPVEFFAGRIDILHILYQKVHSFPVIKAKRIVTVHDMRIFLEVKRDVKWEITNLERRKKEAVNRKQMILNADRIIAVSQNTKNDIIKYLSVPSSKITVVYLGKDDIFRPIDDRYKIKDVIKKYNISKRFILAVLARSPHKNLSGLLKGFWRVRQHYDCQLVIFGKGKYGEWVEILDKLPSDIKNDVIFTGYVPLEEIPYLYNGAEFFIYPSFYEGFGLPPLEAMACGCPVITSNTSSLPEVVGDAGILIDPYNMEEMIKKMEQLLSDGDLRERLKEKGLERAKQFSWEKTARETLKVYEEVYNGK